RIDEAAAPANEAAAARGHTSTFKSKGRKQRVHHVRVCKDACARVNAYSQFAGSLLAFLGFSWHRIPAAATVTDVASQCVDFLVLDEAAAKERAPAALNASIIFF